MESDITRVLAEIFIKKALNDLNDSPERSIRNLINMALNLSESRFQSEFYTTAEIMLRNIQSPYYDIIRDGAAHIDKARLFHFGINLGYNSCTAGANIIRENKKTLGLDIPWTVFIRMDEKRLEKQSESYNSVITQGEELGIYTWMFSCNGQLYEILPLIQQHKDSAFILFCSPENLTEEFLDNMSDVKHVMLAVRYRENTENIFRLLRERQLLYSVYYIYGEDKAESIINGNLFYDTAQLHPLITAIIAGEDCPEETRKRVYRAVVDFREKQTFRTVVLDLKYDNIISKGLCSVRFDSEENFYINRKNSKQLCLFEQNLSGNLKQAFLKLKQQEG